MLCTACSLAIGASYTSPMQFCQSGLCLPATGGFSGYVIGPDWCCAGLTMFGSVLRKFFAPSMSLTRSETVFALSYTFQPAKPMMPTAIRMTAVNRSIGPQLRPWLTLTGAMGRRPPNFAAGFEAPAFAAGRVPADFVPADRVPADLAAFVPVALAAAAFEAPAAFEVAADFVADDFSSASAFAAADLAAPLDLAAPAAFAPTDRVVPAALDVPAVAPAALALVPAGFSGADSSLSRFGLPP